MGGVIRPPVRITRLLILLGLALGACAAAPATEPRAAEPSLEEAELTALVEVAKRSYRASDYAKAISSYQLAMMAGLEGPEIQANLGSACLAAERLGCASIAYLRASILAPRSPEIARRLQALRTQVPDARRPAGWSWLRDRLAFAEILRAMLATWMLLGLALYLRQHAGDALVVRALVRMSALTLILFGAFALGRWVDARVRPTAVVVAPTGSQLSALPHPEPSDDPSPAALAAGTWVRVLDTRAGYVQIETASGGIGWVPSSVIEVIDCP